MLTDNLAEGMPGEKETGVPAGNPARARAFDEIFPLPNGWFRDTDEGGSRILILMPAVMRGIGAHRRRISKGLNEYKDLGLKDAVRARIASDNNAAAQLLDCDEKELIK